MSNWETNYKAKRRFVLIASVVILTISILLESVSAFGINVDTSPRFSDDYGWFFYIGFPFSQSVVNFISLSGIVDDIFVDNDDNTLIDVIDEDYIGNKEARTEQMDALTFLQWFQYVNHAHRFVTPIESVYMKATDDTVVECRPVYNSGRDLYEVLCWEAS